MGMTTSVAIRQEGADFYFVDPVETLFLRQERDESQVLSEGEVEALRQRFHKASDTLESIDQALAGVAAVMCIRDDAGIGSTAAINLSGLFAFLSDQVATSNKQMADAHFLM